MVLNFVSMASQISRIIIGLMLATSEVAGTGHRSLRAFVGISCAVTFLSFLMTVASVKRYIGTAAGVMRRAASQSVILVRGRMSRIAPVPDPTQSAAVAKAAATWKKIALDKGADGMRGPAVQLHVSASVAIAAEAAGGLEHVRGDEDAFACEGSAAGELALRDGANEGRSLSGASGAAFRVSASAACSDGHATM